MKELPSIELGALDRYVTAIDTQIRATSDVLLRLDLIQQRIELQGSQRSHRRLVAVGGPTGRTAKATGMGAAGSWSI